MIGIILTIALVGLVVWLITTYVPMPAPFKQIIMVVVVILLVLWLINVFGIVDIPLGHYRR